MSDRFRKYMNAILIGLPTWFVIGILINQSDRFAKAMYGSTSLDSGKSIMFAYIAISVGDILVALFASGSKAEKKDFFSFISLGIVTVLLFFSDLNNSDSIMYFFCAMLGFSTGYWAIFVTMGAEQFGTNLRATAATTIPNMVRGALPLMNLFFLNLFQKSWGWRLTAVVWLPESLLLSIGFIGLIFYRRDLP